MKNINIDEIRGEEANIYGRPIYVYGMRLRGFSLGTQPMEGLVYHEEPTSDSAYYDLLFYNRPLSKEEMKAYDLDEVTRIYKG